MMVRKFSLALTLGSTTKALAFQIASGVQNTLENECPDTADALPHLQHANFNKPVPGWDVFAVANGEKCDIGLGNASAPWRLSLDYDAIDMNQDAICANYPAWDYNSKNHMFYCKESIKGTESAPQQYLAKEENKPDRHVIYTYSIPDACKPGGAKAPCPMLVALPGAKGESIVKCFLSDQNCVDNHGVVLLLPTIDSPLEKTLPELAGKCNLEDVEWLRPLVLEFMSNNSKSVDKSRVMLFGQSMGATAAVWGAIRSPDIYSHVYATSPKSLWRPSPKGTYTPVNCMHDGLDPTHDYKSFVENTIPIWTKRAHPDVRRLKRFVILVGAKDTFPGKLEGFADFDPFVKMMADLDVVSHEVKGEVRFFAGLPHRAWVAAFNQAYDLLWRGQESVNDGWDTNSVV